MYKDQAHPHESLSTVARKVFYTAEKSEGPQDPVLFLWIQVLQISFSPNSHTIITLDLSDFLYVHYTVLSPHYIIIIIHNSFPQLVNSCTIKMISHRNVQL